ncbi:MAG: hypothetical protein KGM98_08995 [Bacteroidota bacterium]|nr:hypothetical protein [Bacteroidota bacterium]
MKRKLFWMCLLVAITPLSKIHGQDIQSPVDYLSAIQNAQVSMNQKYMVYMSAAAHGRRARKVEKLRNAVLESIEDCRNKTIDLPIYKGDNSLRQSSIDYIKLCYNIFNEDYGKIVNMEDIAERSYDDMQAYLLLREITNQKISGAVAKMDSAARTFAAKYQIQLVDSKNELDQKLDESGKVNDYADKVYLAFFKCNWEDGKIVSALNKQKMTEVEQSRMSLLKFVQEGLSSLDTLKSFQQDPSLYIACKEALMNYRKLASEVLPKQTDYFLKKESFEKTQQHFNQMADDQKTRQVVDTYNQAVKDMNDAANAFNQNINTSNQLRSQIINNWNEAEKNFYDSHIPKYR